MNRGIVWCPHCGRPHTLGTQICPTSAKTIDRGLHRSPQESHPLIGVTLGGKYVVQRLIGSGGMGTVFEAENRLLKRMVAIKIVDATANDHAIERLEREAMLVSAIQHPNVCDVYDIGRLSDGSPFIVLERLFGETLGQLISRTGALSLRRTVDIFTQILSGLHAAHGVHIVHRDLKPANVYLADRIGLPPLVKIVDFGFAKDTSGIRARTITKPGYVLGTAKYMSPEQLKGLAAEPRSDLFTVGVMLHEALTTEHPFGAPTLADLHANVLRGSPTPVSARRPKLPPAVTALVLRAVARDPNERFGSAVAFQRALVAAAGNIQDEPPPSSLPPDSL